MNAPAQHTPGPWHVNTQYADIEVRGPEGSGVLITVMAPWGIGADTPSPQRANARLIAAAPDLWSIARSVAAERLHAEMPGDGGPCLCSRCALVKEARAAIARATGAAA